MHRKAFMGPPRLYDLQIYAVSLLQLVNRFICFNRNPVCLAVFSLPAELILASVLLDNGGNWLAAGTRRWRTSTKSL